MKRKEPKSMLDELMPVDDLPGMALYFSILRAVGGVIGSEVDIAVARHHSLAPRYRGDILDCTTYLLALAPVSAVAALWFVPRLIALALRKVRRPGYYEREKARRQALAHERRSTRRRTTLNPVPTPEALLAQFGRIRRKPREMLLFGSMLEDLEAYVDNDLVRDDDGRIVGRHGGIKQWLNERCPELGKRYHTVMRYKALAKRFKQVIDLEDPVPVAYALAAAETPVEVVVGVPEGGAAEMQLRCGQKTNGGDTDGEATASAGAGATEMQLRCGQNGRGAKTDGGRCVVEAVTPERFDRLRGSAAVAEGCRCMARIMAAAENARAFLAGGQETAKAAAGCQETAKDAAGCQATSGGAGCRTAKDTQGKMQLRCGPEMEGGGRRVAETGGMMTKGMTKGMTKKYLDEQLAFLLDPGRTPASPRGSLQKRHGQGRRRAAIASALA